MSEIDWSKAPEGATHWMPESRSWEAGFWKREGEANYFFEGGEWRFSRAKPFGHPAMVKRPSPQWNGDGLPPVRAAVEAFYMGAPQGVVTVRYAGQCMILWSDERNSEQCGAAEDYLFRHIRTPEQIADEEREKAAKDMATLMTGHDNHQGEWGCYVILGKILYDAGYRKVEP